MDTSVVTEAKSFGTQGDTQIYFNKQIPTMEIKVEPEDFDVNDTRVNCVRSAEVITQPIDTIKKEHKIGSSSEREPIYGNCAALFVETLMNEEQSTKDKTFCIVEECKGNSSESDNAEGCDGTSDTMYTENEEAHCISGTEDVQETDTEADQGTVKIYENSTDEKINGTKTVHVVLRKLKIPMGKVDNCINITTLKGKELERKTNIRNALDRVEKKRKKVVKKCTKNVFKTAKKCEKVTKTVTETSNNELSEEEADREARLNPNVKNEDGQEIFECRLCKKTYSNLKSYKAHSYDHKGKHICDVCQTQFSRNSNLKVHMRRHLGEKPFACHLCKSKFSASGDLTRHLLLHTGEKPFKCLLCDSCFSQKAHLDGHLRSHSTEKPFKCSLCDACYTQKNNLTFHMRKHTGEKPYSCRLCCAKFWGNYDLKRHVQRSHRFT